MHTTVTRANDALLAEIRRFRQQVYLRARREEEQLSAWLTDRYDELAYHVVVRNERGRIVGIARLLEADDWTLNDRYSYAYDPVTDFEIGRFGVLSEGNRQKDISLAIVGGVVRWSRDRGYTRCFGFTVLRFVMALKRYGVPFEVLSPPVSPYGEPTRLLGFSIAGLDDYDRRRKDLKRSSGEREVSLGLGGSLEAAAVA